MPAVAKKMSGVTKKSMPRHFANNDNKVPVPHNTALKYKVGELRTQDRDDELDFIIECIITSGLRLDQIADNAQSAGHNISAFTMLRWLYGYTNKPQNRTINAAMVGMGYRKTWTKD